MTAITLDKLMTLEHWTAEERALWDSIKYKKIGREQLTKEEKDFLDYLDTQIADLKEYKRKPRTPKHS